MTHPHPPDSTTPPTTLPPESPYPGQRQGEAFLLGQSGTPQDNKNSDSTSLPPITESLLKKQQREHREQRYQERIQEQGTLLKRQDTRKVLERKENRHGVAKPPSQRQRTSSSTMPNDTPSESLVKQKRVEGDPTPNSAFRHSRQAVEEKLAQRYNNARKRHMTLFQYRRQQKQRSVWLRRLKGLFRFLASVAMLMGVVWLIQAPFWNIQVANTRIEGNGFVPTQIIRHLLMDWDQNPLYEVDPQLIAQHLKEKLPVIQTVSINRRFNPVGLESTLSVELVEKKPWIQLLRSSDSLMPYGLMLSDHTFVPWVGLRLTPQLRQEVAHLPRIVLAPGDRTKLQSNQVFWNQLHLLTYQLAYLEKHAGHMALTPVLQSGKSMDEKNLGNIDRANEPARSLNDTPSSGAERSKMQPAFRLDTLQLGPMGRTVDLTLNTGAQQKLQVRLGGFHQDVTRRLERLWSSLSMITEYPNPLESVDLQWNNQVVLKKQSKQNARTSDTP